MSERIEQRVAELRIATDKALDEIIGIRKELKRLSECAPKTNCEHTFIECNQSQNRFCTKCAYKEVITWVPADPQPERTLDYDERLELHKLRQKNVGYENGYKQATEDLQKKFEEEVANYCGEYVDNYLVVKHLRSKLFNG
jgi:hypothetical protein